MRTLYFDCFAGASGNMILGGLVALGVDRDALVAQVATVTPVSFAIEFTDVNRSGIAAVHANVRVPDEKAHRHLSDIEKIIESSAVSHPVKERSKAIFRRLADAEGKVHGLDPGQIYFHEVGAMDAIVDIVGSCIGFEMLGIERFLCSKIHVGSGFIDIAHGKFPVPPPAVTELLKGTPFYSTEIVGELATPTGVAIITTLCDDFESNVDITSDQVGYGAGTREYDNFPNALRMIVGETEARGFQPSRDEVTLLETNIDDLSPQILGFVMERAFELGALDCWFTPIQMKKNRPAVMVSVLCEPESRAALTDLLYRETTTLGIRVRAVVRECLERETVRVPTEFGEVDVKLGNLNGNVVNAMPEYEQVRRIALDKDLEFRTVRDAALAAFNSSRSRAASS
ncbi:MAG: nickel pincer cofactor biosynthesis protein LarC [Pyrinomonadaceae bacterium]